MQFEIEKKIIKELDDKDFDSKYHALLFFKYSSNKFPTLSKIARVLLCVPATSVPSESLLSISGIIKNDQRNRLKPDILEMLNIIKFR